MADLLRRRIIIWTPRIFSVAIAFTFALLATDAFHQAGNKIIQFGDFMLFLLPSLLMIGASFAAWYWPRAGGAVMILLAGLYELSGGWQGGAQAHLIVTLPLVVCGGLFVVSGYWERRKGS